MSKMRAIYKAVNKLKSDPSYADAVRRAAEKAATSGSGTDKDALLDALALDEDDLKSAGVSRAMLANCTGTTTTVTTVDCTITTTTATQTC